MSAYGQFGTGILLLLGLLTRPAAAVVVVNFVVALAPRYSLDAVLAQRGRAVAEPVMGSATRKVACRSRH